jgi:hypothetical protein
MAKPWLRELVASLSSWKAGFSSSPINVGFLVTKVALGQLLLKVLPFSPICIILPMLHFYSNILLTAML